MSTLKVDVRLYATLSKYSPAGGESRSFTVEVEQGTTLGQLYEILRIPPGEIKQAFINGRRVEEDYVLQDKDEIGVFPPVAGG
ncbi:MAG: MoaD/ThiS family protein [Thermoanaerobacteraceae bacterium]|nr:MoaD/ThiS family protein [Thermoanaerobacteraceae bacterium]